MEVEIREKPRPFPPFTPFLRGAGGTKRVGLAAGGNGTAGMAAAAVVAGTDGANSFPVDSAGLSPDVLFCAYLERERQGGGRNVSKEARVLFFCSLVVFFAEVVTRNDLIQSHGCHSLVVVLHCMP